ncbi:uncharacterized protein LOC124170359 [Ischnura elegans]|uniref:uncharacterized protein LOC124170359 n=1 Tax=Ischnura elegans TaxID=197161 RepID=UPI001ED894EB|nr:uncharacterized protein LOC124170359 [Ischnura elegans]
MVEILKVLIEVTEKLSTAVDKDVISEEELELINEMWDKMWPSDKMRMRTILFVVISQIQRAIMTNWGLEEDLKPVAQVREIVQKLLVFVRTTRSDHGYILRLQREVSNHTWRFNHLDEYKKRLELNIGLPSVSLLKCVPNNVDIVAGKS